MAKYEIQYFVCSRCDFWATEDPWWLDEAYSSAISSMDTGIARRTITCQRVLAPALRRLFGTGRPFVDWAGGHGLLTRLMRDVGLDYYWQDDYAANTFAAGFEWGGASGRAAAVTAIEVFEHVPDPVDFLGTILGETGTDSVCFTQELHRGVDPNWWYLTPETGQHVAFYSSTTLRTLAARFDMAYLSAGWIHLLTSRDISEARFRREIRLAPYRFEVLQRRGNTRIEDDMRLAAAKIRDSGAFG